MSCTNLLLAKLHCSSNGCSSVTLSGRYVLHTLPVCHLALSAPHRNVVDRRSATVFVQQYRQSDEGEVGRLVWQGACGAGAVSGRQELGANGGRASHRCGAGRWRQRCLGRGLRGVSSGELSLMHPFYAQPSSCTSIIREGQASLQKEAGGEDGSICPLPPSAVPSISSFGL